ncbi:vWA domain-containing protein [Frankia sp. Cr2]|uniref:vWA domain-containing protein n=1 Tax=Frankia sp. Cr2 TaxID=3073932 RepID=UPI002AD30F96|nr:vWA domain-containing protein [Frankia sp. Cr2]
MSTARFGRALAGICITVAIAFWAVPVNAQTRSPDPAAPVPKTSPQPVRVQILVDESANVTVGQIDWERDAAKKIAASALAGTPTGDYQVAVAGYGSAPPPPAEGKPTFDRVCPFQEAGLSATATATTTGSSIAECLKGLHPRKAAEGNDSDIAGALKFFEDDLVRNTPLGTRRVLVLFTGGTANRRNQLVNAVPTDLRTNQIEVWPLGFGSADAASLDAIARGGFQGSGTCERDTPSVHMAGTGDDLIPAATAVASALTPRALCRSEAKRRIPLPATDATIRVRHEDRLTFNFCQPHPVGGPQDCSDSSFVKIGKKTPDGSTFERPAGADGYDRLHVTRPMPGEWTVVATASPGGPPIMFDVQVEWEGTPRTAMLVRPTPPQPGPNGGPPMVNVEARLYTRAGALELPRALAGVTARLTVDYGTGSQPPEELDAAPRFAADAGGSDIIVFSTHAPFKIPVAASGPLTFTATVSWPDAKDPAQTAIIYATSIQKISEAKKNSGPTVTFPTFNGPLPRGGSVSGYLTVTGNWGRIREITLCSPESWAALGVTMDTVTLRPNEMKDGQPKLLTIRAGDHASLGPTGGIIEAFDQPVGSCPDDRLGNFRLGDQFVALTVVPFPADSPVNEWLVAFFVLVSLIITTTVGAGILEFRSRITRHATVAGLKISLYRDNIACDVLEPSAPGESTISFGIDNVDGTSRGDPSFSTDDANVSSAGQRFTVQRNGQNGMIQLERNSPRESATHPVGDKLAHLLNERVYFIIADTTQNAATTGATSTMEP